MEPRYLSESRERPLSAGISRSFARPAPVARLPEQRADRVAEDHKALGKLLMIRVEFLRDKMKEAERPQTSQVAAYGLYLDQDVPKYKMSLREKAVRDKQFDFKKKFSTIPKKSDPVSRMQELTK